LWIIFTTRKYAALRTPGSELKKYDLLWSAAIAVFSMYEKRV